MQFSREICQNVRVFHKIAEVAIKAILASQALPCENKKNLTTECYLKENLNLGSDALLIELWRHVLHGISKISMLSCCVGSH